MQALTAPSLFSEPPYRVRVSLSGDGYLIFSKARGVEIYDIPVSEFKKNTAHWLRQLQAKNWFTAEVESECLELAGIYLRPF